MGGGAYGGRDGMKSVWLGALELKERNVYGGW